MPSYLADQLLRTVPTHAIRQLSNAAHRFTSGMNAMNVETTKESSRSRQTDGKPDEVGLASLTACEKIRDERKRFELQARIVAGSLVLMGVMLGLIVHPYF